MDFLRSNKKQIFLIVLVFLNFIVWIQYLSFKPKDALRVVFLNVGQGDAIYIRTPSGNDMLIDSGRDKTVLRELGAVMPWNDNDLDVILETHADADHIGGFPEILKRFKVSAVIESGNRSKTNQIDGQVENLVKEKNIPKILGRKGTIVDLGDGVKFEILFPDVDVSGWETNKGSIVGVLSYKSKRFLLTGDSPVQIENYLIGLGLDLDVDVLKPAHHGSKTSTGQNYLNATTPTYAAISAGKNNRYGHPAKEVVERLARAGVKTFETFINGRIEFKTDGINLTPIFQFE